MGHAQAPVVQVAPVGHARPQAPQLVLLVCVFTQVPPQSVWPVGQPQRPAVQVWPPPQRTPQAPQLRLFVCRSMQAAPPPPPPPHAV